MNIEAGTKYPWFPAWFNARCVVGNGTSDTFDLRNDCAKYTGNGKSLWCQTFKNALNYYGFDNTGSWMLVEDIEGLRLREFVGLSWVVGSCNLSRFNTDGICGNHNTVGRVGYNRNRLHNSLGNLLTLLAIT